MIFLDTCLLIDYSKEKINLKIKQNNYCISSIVQLEFKVGARDKRELKSINKIISEFKQLDTDQNILNLANDIIEKYSLSHGIGIYDAIIAATCLIYKLPLLTYNKKDFKFIENLKLINL